MLSCSSVTSDSTIALCVGLALVLAPVLSSGIRAADKPPSPSACTRPDAGKSQRQNLWPRPKFAKVHPALEGADETATLQALQLALSEVGDGASYTWDQPQRALRGRVQPTASFKDIGGRICRHIVLELAAGAYRRRAEGIACRLANGAWQLEG